MTVHFRTAVEHSLPDLSSERGFPGSAVPHVGQSWDPDPARRPGRREKMENLGAGRLPAGKLRKNPPEIACACFQVLHTAGVPVPATVSDRGRKCGIFGKLKKESRCLPAFPGKKRSGNPPSIFPATGFFQSNERVSPTAPEESLPARKARCCSRTRESSPPSGGVHSAIFTFVLHSPSGIPFFRDMAVNSFSADNGRCPASHHAGRCLSPLQYPIRTAVPL